MSRTHAAHPHHTALLPRSVFLRRLGRSASLGVLFIAASLLLGATGDRRGR